MRPAHFGGIYLARKVEETDYMVIFIIHNTPELLFFFTAVII